MVWSRMYFLVGVAIGVLTLSACETPYSVESPTLPSIAVPQHDQVETDDESAIPSSPPQRLAAVVPPPVPPTTSRSISPPVPPVIPRFDPASALGWSPEKLTMVLGEADYVRRDGKAAVYQYRTEHCIVDFTFFPQATTLEVIAWHGRSRIQHRNVDADACFTGLGKRKTAP